MPLDTSAIVSLVGAAFSVGSAIWIHTRQLKLQLFEKRVVVYDATCAFLAYPMQHGKPHESPQFQEFWHETRNAEFLFGPEIKHLLDRVSHTASDYRAKYRAWESKPDDHPEKDTLYERQATCDQELEELWKPVHREFRKYLRLARIGPEFE